MRSSALVGWFADVGLADRLQVGGKGGSLGELTRAGIAVPPGFVLKTSAFERFLGVLESEGPVREQVESLEADDLESMTALSVQLRARFAATPLPADVADEIAEAHDGLCEGAARPAVAVRSSATTEDASDASFAGLQDTYLWVRGARQTQERVRQCWGSLYSVESMSYRRKRGFKEKDVAMAVVVQSMVDARTAGVMFTRSPLTGDRSVMTIEGSWGLGSAVVGGEVTPDRWVVGKITGEISVREISTKLIRHTAGDAGGVTTVAVPDELQRMPCLSDDEIQHLRATGRKAERHYGQPQDIEWAVASGSEEILLLQSRPETVWSAREPVPVGRAAADPSSHVLSIFGIRR
ncbi:MAG TPA: PEP/pyruvate-binding domain-containing protein [Steroidobacteraceae bacterium]|jgi:pyruvate,water dikinase